MAATTSRSSTFTFLGSTTLALSLKVGCGRVNSSRLLKKLKAGIRNIHTDYTSFCHYPGRKHPGLYRRRLLELTLLFTP